MHLQPPHSQGASLCPAAHWDISLRAHSDEEHHPFPYMQWADLMTFLQSYDMTEIWRAKTIFSLTAPLPLLSLPLRRNVNQRLQEGEGHMREREWVGSYFSNSLGAWCTFPTPSLLSFDHWTHARSSLQAGFIDCHSPKGTKSSAFRQPKIGLMSIEVFWIL